TGANPSKRHRLSHLAARPVSVPSSGTCSVDGTKDRGDSYAGSRVQRGPVQVDGGSGRPRPQQVTPGHPVGRLRQTRKLRQIEDDLRRDDPGLDTLLAGWAPSGRRGSRGWAVWVLAVYLVPAVLVLAGLLVPVSWLVLGGVAACPFVPVLAWLLIRG